MSIVLARDGKKNTVITYFVRAADFKTVSSANKMFLVPFDIEYLRQFDQTDLKFTIIACEYLIFF
jgi:hypothetical protein